MIYTYMYNKNQPNAKYRQIYIDCLGFFCWNILEKSNVIYIYKLEWTLPNHLLHQPWLKLLQVIS